MRALACVSTVLLLLAQPCVAQQQTAVPIRRSVLEQYVGEYVYPSGERSKVRLIGDTIFREIPGQIVPFVPFSETLFRLGPVMTAEFVIDRKGNVTQILSDGVDIEYRLARIAPGSSSIPVPAQPSPPVAMRVPVEILKRYVGVYDFIPGQMKRTDLRVIVRLGGDVLTRQMTGGPETILTPLSETRFRVGATALDAEFAVGADGEMMQFMGYGFQQLVVRRVKR